MATVKHLFIVNPVAGNGIALRMTDTIHKLFKELKLKYTDIDYEIVYTKEEGHATEIARRYSAKADYRIYAVGGDGTLNEVLNGMVGSGSSLGCIPGGSGNDFIKSIVTKFDRRRILMNTVLGSEEEIDLGEVDGRYFINIASMGFDASVVNNVEKFKAVKLLPNKFAYLASVLDTAKDFQDLNLRMVIDGEELDTSAFMVAIANGKYYGGGIKIAPDANIRDGLLDVILVRNITRSKIMRFLPLAVQGKHMDLEEVTFQRAKSISLYSDEPVYVNIDGELEARREAHFSIGNQKVKFIIPKNSF
ncbi:diacylglycerol kinase family lipid kinase [Proteiniclasticum sp. BAD-10]|uniref:Diacylglycerol kinase family lipid kinase n=1 Tax=Proteiniclasticum sediminis TaxID=2804028 RepID=A0A941CR25_9CLOT|nr:diacylglycerol kinase family protein [Proteiniclasticum sediminis]MBR0575751.1 diacylglycerol kinase family lipid kinase [Proteiniclasticum sediminis]